MIDTVDTTRNRVKGEIVTARKPGTKEPLNTFHLYSVITTVTNVITTAISRV